MFWATVSTARSRIRSRSACRHQPVPVAPGGTIANVGAPGVKVDLHLERLWSNNVTINTRLVDTVTIPMLLKTVQSKRVDASRLITPNFKLDQINQAHESFGRAADTKALKLIIEA
jgi:alcohol dehydrogenase